jgi:hypothetical protein
LLAIIHHAKSQIHQVVEGLKELLFLIHVGYTSLSQCH